MTTTGATSVNIVSSIENIPSDYRAYVLAEIRCAVLRTKLLETDLTTIGIALKAGLIDADEAVEHLWSCDALRLVAPSSATLAST